MMTEDLSVLFNDFGSDVIFGLFSFKGIFDSPDMDLGMNVSTEYTLTIKFSDLSTIEDGSSLTVNGVAYEVRGEPKLIDDGKLIKMKLNKV